MAHYGHRIYPHGEPGNQNRNTLFIREDHGFWNSRSRNSVLRPSDSSKEIYTQYQSGDLNVMKNSGLEYLLGFELFFAFFGVRLIFFLRSVFWKIESTLYYQIYFNFPAGYEMFRVPVWTFLRIFAIWLGISVLSTEAPFLVFLDPTTARGCRSSILQSLCHIKWTMSSGVSIYTWEWEPFCAIPLIFLVAVEYSWIIQLFAYILWPCDDLMSTSVDIVSQPPPSICDCGRVGDHFFNTFLQVVLSATNDADALCTLLLFCACVSLFLNPCFTLFFCLTNRDLYCVPLVPDMHHWAIGYRPR